MKVCFVGSKNLKHMTLISLYTVFLEKNKITYDIIYIDYEGSDEQYQGCNRIYKYTLKTPKNFSLTNRLRSILSYRKYIRFAKKIISKEKYDFLIVWGDEAAALFSNFLTKHKCNQYSINIRDLWDFNDSKHSQRVFRSIDSARFTTVSSDAFLDYLPSNNCLFVPSYNKALLGEIKKECINRDIPVKQEKTINIVSIGAFRNDDYNKHIVDSFANDLRFRLKFIGKGSDRIAKYCSEKNYTNVECVGAFVPDKTIDYLSDAAIVNCAYGAASLAEKTKLPIRLYYAIFFHLPVLATSGTWIERKAKDLGMCISIPSEDLITNCDLPKMVYSQFSKIDHHIMHMKINNHINDIEKLHMDFEKELKTVLRIK